MARRLKALVLMTSPLDKIVHAARVVDELTRQAPELEVTWVVRRVYEPLVASFPFVSKTIVFRRSGALVKAVGLVMEIRRDEYDFVLDFEGHARTGAMCFLARGKRKIGLRSAREGATVFYREVVGRTDITDTHLVDQLREFGPVFGVDLEIERSLGVTVCEVLPSAWLAAKRRGLRRVCLFPTRFKSERSWPGMVALAGRLSREFEDVAVFLLGFVPPESPVELPAGVNDLQERLSWAEIVSMLQDADLVIANDNGPAQLAGALGTPNLTLYTYVSPLRRGSFPLNGKGNAALQSSSGRACDFEEAAVMEQVERLLNG